MLATWLIDQGDVGSNPAQGNYSFPQKLSSVEFPVTFSQFLLNLDYESICEPPGGDTLLAQGIYLTDSTYIYIYTVLCKSNANEIRRISMNFAENNRYFERNESSNCLLFVTPQNFLVPDESSSETCMKFPCLP